MNTQRSVPALDDRIPSYFRMHHQSPRHRWWRPLAELSVASVAFVLLLGMLMIAAGFLTFVPGFESTVDAAFESDTVDMTDPTTFVLLNLTLIPLIPAVLIGIRLAGARPTGSIVSETGRFRWDRLWRAVLVATPIYVVFLAVGLAIEPDVEPVFDADAWLLLGLVLLLTPLQAAAEEFAFRGLLGQMIGAWLRHPLWAIALPIPLFVIGHDYSAAGLLDVGVFALCVGVLAWRTGGLEAPIGVHVVNNVLVLALGAFGIIDVNDASVSWVATTFGCALTIVVTAAILRTEARTPNAETATPRSEASQESQLLPL